MSNDYGVNAFFDSLVLKDRLDRQAMAIEVLRQEVHDLEEWVKTLHNVLGMYCQWGAKADDDLSEYGRKIEAFEMVLAEVSAFKKLKKPRGKTNV